MVKLKLCDGSYPPGMTNSLCNDPDGVEGGFANYSILDSNEPYPPQNETTLQKNLTLDIPEQIYFGVHQYFLVDGFAQLSVETILDIDVPNNYKPVSGLKISCAGQIILNSYSVY